jgi:hypothetical protein
MMKEIVILDNELWTDVGAMKRKWRGMNDFPPLVMQMGAARISLDDDCVEVQEWFSTYVWPQDEFGNLVNVTDFFTELTGITEDTIVQEGVAFSAALDSLASFCGPRNIYSYGNDVLNNVVPSCFIAGVDVPFRADQCFDIKFIFHRAGLAEDFLLSQNSGNLCNALGLPIDIGQHNAQQDVLSQVEVIKHLHMNKMLQLDWLLNPGNIRKHIAYRSKGDVNV